MSLLYIEREVKGQPSTERVLKRKKALLEAELRISTERARLYTEYIKEHWNDPPYTRQGGALKHVLSNLTPVIHEDELIVGSISPFLRGTQLYPEQEYKWLEEALLRIEREEERFAVGTRAKAVTVREGLVKIGIFGLDPSELPILREIIDFWKEKDCRSVSERVLKQREDFDQVWKWQRQLVFLPFMFDVPEGRLIVNYGRVIEEGVESIIQRCRDKIKQLGSLDRADKLDKYDFYNGVILALQGLIAFAENYAKEAKRLAEKAEGRRRDELLEIARICSKVPRYKAESFKEALQSFWFTHCALFIELNGRGISPGRFDQYMYPLFKKDLKSGKISKEEALELLELLRIKHSELVRAHATFTESYLGGSLYQNLTIGGVDRFGNSAENELSLLILQAGINTQTHQPTISVRWNEKLSKEFKRKVVECIKAGAGYPAIFNDNLGIERFLRFSGATLEDARDWAPCGCVDMQICGKRMPMYAVPNTNMAKILELILFNGVNPVTGEKLIDTNIDADTASFDELKEEFKRVMSVILEKEAQYWNTVMLVHNKLGLVHPLTSALLDDCLEKGIGAAEGGCRYNDSPYLISCGMINVANSLAAIKKYVFEDKAFTIKELKNALKANFKGYEHIKRRLLAAPKYGNDDDYVDQLAVELYDAYAEAVERNLNWLGEPWRPSGISVTSQVVLGQATGATPDGREAFQPLADGSTSAHPGTDVNGPTALIHSSLKIHHINLQSTLMNMKFNPLAIEGDAGTDKLIALIDTFIAGGGYHIQFNVVDSAMLRDAQKHPEKYPDLYVRVAGFTARFIDLGPNEQEEIIKRTEYLGL